MKRKVLSRLLLPALGLLIGSAVFVAPQLARSSDGSVPTQAKTLSVTAAATQVPSAIIESDFSFNAVGAKWEGSADLSIRTRTNTGWTDWTSLIVDEDSASRDGQGIAAYANLLFTDPSDALQYRIDGGEAPSGLEFFYLNTMKKESWSDRWLGWMAREARGDLSILSRQDWGADESIRFDGDQEIWPPEYATPEVFIIHHTAGSNGQPSLDQAKAVIRGIYYYHTVIRGWGDIGYNYLIDTAGHVFEGRFGGDGVTGAHTYRTGCPGKGADQGYNTGSVGVALLGNYESTDTLSSESQSALVDLLAEKGRALGIDPDSETYFKDRTISTVFGHIDVDCTVCPGEHLRSELDTVRTLAGEAYESLPSSGAKLLESPMPSAILSGGSREVTFLYKNTGTSTWTRNEVKVKVESPDGSASPFAIRANGVATDRVPMSETSVAPGAQGHFTFTATAPTELGTYYQRFVLMKNDDAISGGTKIKKTRVDSSSQAGLAELNVPVAMLDTWRSWATIKMTNTGVTTWNRSVVLKIMNDDFGPSSFYDSSWPGAVGEIVMQEGSVPPGGTATYRFLMRAPVHSQIYTQIFQLIDRSNGNHVIQHRHVVSLIRIDPTYASLEARQYSAERGVENIPAAVRSSWRPTVTVRYTNTGTQTWDRSVKLNIYGALYRRPEFRDGSWPRETGGITMNESSVPPGGTASYTFRLDAPDELQVYEIYFRLSRGPEQVAMPGSYFSELIRVDR